MTITQQTKTEWIDQASKEAVAEFSHNDEQLKREALLLSFELERGFQGVANDLMKLHSPAGAQLYEWAEIQGHLFDELFQSEPAKLTKEPWEVINLIQRSIPGQFIDYYFHAARDLYFQKDFIRADRAFRFLTLLYPQNCNLWTWLGYCQQVRKLPELALTSYAIASTLIEQNFMQVFYVAECWMVLNCWSLAKTYLEKTLSLIGDDSKNVFLKTKCQELLADVATYAASPEKVSRRIDQILLFTGKPMEALVALRSLYNGTAAPSNVIPPSPSEWKEIFARFKGVTNAIQADLSTVKDQLNVAPNSLGFFENNMLKMKPNGVSLSLDMLPFASSIAASVFLREFVVRAFISQAATSIKGNVKGKVADDPTLAAILAQCPSPMARNIDKYCFYYQQQYDIAVNKMVQNPEYGSEEWSYDEKLRQKPEVRAARFHPEDIVGKSLMDFGCNQGNVLLACRQLGAGAITGIDINAWCIEQVNKLVTEQNIQDAKFIAGDMENIALLTNLPQVDTVFLLAILDTSIFVNKTAIIANVSRFAKQTFYYEGHEGPLSHVARMFELYITTGFTRFEYLGTFEHRPLIRCSREMIDSSQLPPEAITTDHPDSELLNASEIYVFTDSPRNPAFGVKCKLIQFVKR